MRRMFSEKQIEKLVDEKALNEGIVAKTLEQTEANISLNPSFVEIEELTLDEKMYKACKVINGVLWIIVAGKFTTSADYQTQTEFDLDIDLPEEIASKIYTYSGNKVSDSSANDNNIASKAYYLSGTSKYCSLVRNAKNQMRLRFIGVTSVGAGETNNINVRFPLIIL